MGWGNNGQETKEIKRKLQSRKERSGRKGVNENGNKLENAGNIQQSRQHLWKDEPSEPGKGKIACREI